MVNSMITKIVKILGGLDRVSGFAILKKVKLTALSVRRDGGFYFYE